MLLRGWWGDFSPPHPAGKSLLYGVILSTASVTAPVVPLWLPQSKPLFRPLSPLYIVVWTGLHFYV